MGRRAKIRLGMLGSVGHGKNTLNAAIEKLLLQRNPEQQTDDLKPYLASLRRSPMHRVGILAQTAAEAKSLLEKQYGKGNIILIRRVEAPSDLPRG